MKKAEKQDSSPAKKADKTAPMKAVKKTAAPTAVASGASAPTPPPAPAPAKKASPAPSKDTVIVAKVDVGFGNALYLRGDGPGLSWSKGVPMDYTADNSWRAAMSGVAEAFEFKVLINDTYWSSGYNIIAQPGSSIEFSPDF